MYLIVNIWINGRDEIYIIEKYDGLGYKLDLENVSTSE